MAREQAENETKALRIQLDESKIRCSKLNQRLEAAMVRPSSRLLLRWMWIDL